MQYRNVGNTGIEVSAIGLGCEHLDGKPYEQVEAVIHAALEQKINVFDVFMPGEEIRANIAKALGNRRDEVYIQGHFGSTDLKQQYDISRDMPSVRKYGEALLRHFGYIDFGMLFYIDSEEDYKSIFETEFVDYVLSLKQKGDVHHIGFSSHNPVIAKKAIETGVPEMMLFSINPAFDLIPAEKSVFDILENKYSDSDFHGIDPVRADLYRTCESRGVGITVMKTLGAGKLMSPEHTPFHQPLTAAQCIHYALTRPAVSSVLLGCQTPEEIADAMRYFTATDEERDYAKVVSSMKNDFKGACVYCNHCLPCPAEIDIASVNKFLDIARLNEDDVPPSIRSHYQVLAHHGSECIACGSCEQRCPFGVSVIDNMQDAARIFGE